MKYSIPRFILCLLVMGFLASSLPAIAAEKTKPAPRNPDGTVMIPGEILLAEIKATPWSGRDALRTRVKEAETSYGYQLPEWEARKNSLPEPERSAAEAEFKQLVRARETLRQKIDGLESAGAETWESAKHDLYVAIQGTVATFKKLKARFEP